MAEEFHSHLTKDAMDRKQVVPRSTSTLEFENYIVTTPILSSREAGWEGVMVRAHHVPDEVEWITVPTVPDIHLALVERGAIYIETRDENGPLEALHVHKGDLFLTPGAGGALGWLSKPESLYTGLQRPSGRDSAPLSAESRKWHSFSLVFDKIHKNVKERKAPSAVS